ncbi:MAG TPA: hypothetical protein VMV69_22250 [Pirellulales bacterium]|nr:hypothetical protein [Pirellulales bacterium]
MRPHRPSRQQAGFGRGQAFDDFLQVTVCALATGLMEDEYLATVRKGYDREDQGARGVDYFRQAFGLLVTLMKPTFRDRSFLASLVCVLDRKRGGRVGHVALDGCRRRHLLGESVELVQFGLEELLVRSNNAPASCR